MNIVVNVNKPAGITSHQAVAIVKRLSGAKKAGHTGTLDPMATGVMLICLNEATKISRFLLDTDKAYRARVKVGERTDTGDADGRIIERNDISFLTEDRLVETVMSFAGRITQKPPMYSSVKVGGERLYKLARKGIEVERPERVVLIRDLKVTQIQFPYFELDVTCSKGTYIRTLCDDIGLALGTSAHLAALERTSVGRFSVRNAAGMDDLRLFFLHATDCDGEELREKSVNNNLVRDQSEPGGFIYSIDAALTEMKEIVLDEHNFRKTRNGVPLECFEINGLRDNEFLKLKSPAGELFGIGRVYSRSIRIERILNI